MRRKRVELQERPFHKQGRPTTFVHYRSQQEAFRFLRSVSIDNRGIGLLYGPETSGKTVLVQQFAEESAVDRTVAVVDGAHRQPLQLFSEILAQFGYNVALTTTDELLNLLKVFAVQQTRTRQAPLLVLENINDMYPSALGVLCKLAALSANDRFALDIILTSNEDFHRIIESPSMSAVAQRLIGDFALGPLTMKESMIYLYTKLRSSGVHQPDDVFPVDTCEKIYAASGGWPGKLDEIAMSIIETSSFAIVNNDDVHDLPVLVEEFDYPQLQEQAKAPRLIVTLGGEVSHDIELTDSRALIGRADLCDIVINDQFISKQHALVIRERNTIVLVDLKSSNGTYVNARRIQRAVLRDNDIISIGDHRIKLIYANCQAAEKDGRKFLTDTANMKNVADARRARNKRKDPQFNDQLASIAPISPRRQ